MPVLRGETTSPWRKPHGRRERMTLQATSVQAGAAPPQRTHRPPAQPSSPATGGTVISRNRQVPGRHGFRASSLWRGPGSPSSLSHSSGLLSCAAREGKRKVAIISIIIYYYYSIIISIQTVCLCAIIHPYDQKINCWGTCEDVPDIPSRSTEMKVASAAGSWVFC